MKTILPFTSHRIIPALTLCFGLTLISCGTTPDPIPANPIAQNSEPTPTDTDSLRWQQTPTIDYPLNDLGRFLAGLPVTEHSPYAPLQTLPAYQAHSEEYRSLWRNFHRHRFLPMRDWSQRAIRPHFVGNTLYYPFSGPDIINAIALFPDANHYLLVAREPVGQINRLPTEMPEHELIATLNNMRKSTETMLIATFFITKDMREDIARTDLQGTLPILLTLLALSGHDILDVHYFSITSDSSMATAQSPGLPGIRIAFRTSNGGTRKTLDYVSGDLSNGGLNPQLENWITRFQPGGIYLKAASYLPHEDYFSRVRSSMLNRDAVIVQDDSGIPYRHILASNRTTHLHGTYFQPTPTFAKYHQSDLASAYADINTIVRPLPFGTGYNNTPGESNLQVILPRGR